MSSSIQATIHCDGCPATYQRDGKAHTARRLARQHGWRFACVNGNRAGSRILDLCPTCAKGTRAVTVAARFVEYANSQPSSASWEDIVFAWTDTTEATTVPPATILTEVASTHQWWTIQRQVFRLPDESYAEVRWFEGATENQELDPECEWKEVIAEPYMNIRYVPVQRDTPQAEAPQP